MKVFKTCEESFTRAGASEMLSMRKTQTPRAPSPTQQSKATQTHPALLLQHRPPQQPDSDQTNINRYTNSSATVPLLTCRLHTTSERKPSAFNSRWAKRVLFSPIDLKLVTLYITFFFFYLSFQNIPNKLSFSVCFNLNGPVYFKQANTGMCK